MNVALRCRSLVRMVVAGALAVAVAAPLGAQAHYPAFQIPRVTSREFNFAGADGDHYTALYFQWREGTSSSTQLSLDAGISNSSGVNSEASFLLGGQFAYQIRMASQELPLDMVFTVGVFTNIGGGENMFSLPAGLAVGHRFELQSGMAVTPFAHPRLSLSRCSSCSGNATADTDITPSLDLAVSFEFNQNLGLRAGVLLGSTNARFGLGDVLGISVAWTPTAMTRLVR